MYHPDLQFSCGTQQPTIGVQIMDQNTKDATDSFYELFEEGLRHFERIAEILGEIRDRQEVTNDHIQDLRIIAERPPIPYVSPVATGVNEMVDVVEPPQSIAAKVHHLLRYGPHVHTAIENPKGREFLEWAAANDISPTLLQVSENGQIATDMSVVQQFKSR